MSNDLKRALVVFSGGQDSTTCLAYALSHYQHVETIGFNYQQRHNVELIQRQVILKQFRTLFPAWANRLGDDHIFDMSFISQISDSALIKETEIAFLSNGLPNTFVPGRNLFFLTAAAALSYRRNIQDIIIGVCETDFSGYPDCKNDSIVALEKAIQLGMDSPVRLLTPLMYKNKKQTWDLALELGGQPLIDLIIKETHTCYLGERNTFFPWGYGCGKCPACLLRANGYKQFCDAQ